ncbi:hypothetical protein [Mycobacterium talmoniae]|uniref:Uncharacterized protein n=1 Tax=Mycobacterium talmoniae TaxID=1858794 RepID=A0A1S1N9H2_9MYCO|nr:hypothetical protein [Mycobacterium talmoniae]OHU98231.1 hypothetical protein BKN37_20970 [Mycobacterium talmoniae]PQM47175.1 hypothetical protein C1Y40_02644 [Mycobacterium talmoniae]TDH48645.1 hypothetical protein E2F47_23110 [Mycobacterium eburneum]
MNGHISFLQREWMGGGRATAFVMEFLASRAPDAATRNLLSDMAETNCTFLDLRDPKQAQLVDLIVNELPLHVAGLEDTAVRNNLAAIFEDLYQFAREQQEYNRDPTRNTCFTIGPHEGRYLDISVLNRIIMSQLGNVNYVRIDVSKFGTEQRTTVRDYVERLADPRVWIIRDD